MFNEMICAVLEEKGLSCYLPQRDTDQTAGRKAIFEQNMKALDRSTHLLAIGSNETPNWGFEIGLSYATRRVVILAMNNHALPLMNEFAADELMLVDDLDDINSYIDKLTRILS